MTQVIYEADNEQTVHVTALSQRTGTFPKYDHQRRVAPDD